VHGQWFGSHDCLYITDLNHSATALQSLEIACDTLLSGKAKVMLAGGFDDLSEEGSYEFANMKATSNTATEFAMGREPTEMSRPTTTTRAGFMEAQGTGVHVVMTAKTALELGAPIRGIVAFTSTSTYVVYHCLEKYGANCIIQ
jgi:fatty acid synthase subunit alpha